MGLSIKNRIVLLTVIPLMIAVGIIMLITRWQLLELSEQEVNEVRQEMMQEKQETLKQYMEIAVSSVSEIYENATANDQQAKEKALEILRSITYGAENDGYVFVYSYEGTALAMRAKLSLEGKNLINLKDDNGVRIIADLISAARQGGGYVSYIWDKPSKQQKVDKLSYAVGFPKWQWMLGTGFYTDDIEDRVAEKKAALDSMLTDSMLFIFLVGGVLVVLFGLAAVLFSNSLAKPLADAAIALRNIGQGEGDLTKRLQASSGSEIGLIAQGFNSFADKIQSLIMEVRKAVEAMSGATGRMRVVVDKTHKAVTGQQQETEQVVAAIHQMAMAVQEVARSAGQAAEAARQADHFAGTGQAVVNDTIGAIHGLADGVNNAADVIAELDKNADQIGSVVNVIKDIADQTNLLALNAAIEAARAGEQGRGFSVVADEVRTLANRTQLSTDEIQKMIEKLQQGARQAVKVMEDSRAATLKTVDTAQGASDSLKSITDAVATINEMNTQIACAADQQTAVADEVNRSIHHIAEITDQTSREADELSRMANEMKDLEQRLLVLVKQFKT